MYTKIFLVLALAILSSASLGINNQKQNIEIPTLPGNHHMATTTAEEHRQTIPWAPLWCENYSERIHGNSHGHDDDGKTHCVHFTRYQQHRRRILFCIGGKVILLVSYLCSLACFYFQLTF